MKLVALLQKAAKEVSTIQVRQIIGDDVILVDCLHVEKHETRKGTIVLRAPKRESTYYDVKYTQYETIGSENTIRGIVRRTILAAVSIRLDSLFDELASGAEKGTELSPMPPIPPSTGDPSGGRESGEAATLPESGL